MIDLTCREDQLLRDCHKETSYEIRRAQREGVDFRVGWDVGEFVDQYNAHTVGEGAGNISRATLEGCGHALVIARAAWRGQTVAAHCYLTDRAEARIVMLYSVSLQRRSPDSNSRALSGRANRFLHFAAMLHFKREGYRIYDFGGYAVGTRDPKLMRINEFKGGFGSVVVFGSEHYSIPFYVYKRLEIAWRGLRFSTAKRQLKAAGIVGCSMAAMPVPLNAAAHDIVRSGSVSLVPRLF